MQVEHDDQVYRCPNVKDQHERMPHSAEPRANYCECEQGSNRFSRHAFPPLCVRSLPNNKTFSPRDYFNDPPPAYKKSRRNRGLAFLVRMMARVWRLFFASHCDPQKALIGDDKAAQDLRRVTQKACAAPESAVGPCVSSRPVPICFSTANSSLVNGSGKNWDIGANMRRSTVDASRN